MILFFFILLSFSFSSHQEVLLHIGGTFPMEADEGGWAGGKACLPAVKMALDDVNNSTKVLDGYRLVLHHHDSQCQPGLAVKHMYDLLYRTPVKLMLLAGCSPVTTVVAEAAPEWNLIVLSYGASSPALSNRLRFPTLFRTHPSANLQNPTRVRLFQKFNWKTITILQSVAEVFTTTAKDLEIQCREKNIRVNRQSFNRDPADAIRTMIRQDARIIVGLYYEKEARSVLCEAYRNKLYGRKYVWLLIGWRLHLSVLKTAHYPNRPRQYSDTWFLPSKEENLRCTAKQMSDAAQYHLTTEAVMLSDAKNTVSGMNGTQFRNRLMSLLDTDPANTAGFPEAPLAYDAVWALALAFNCMMARLKLADPNIKLEHFSYDNQLIYLHLFACMKATQFPGVSVIELEEGDVSFSDSGDRIARIQIEQMQDRKYLIMGYYDSTDQKLEWLDKELFADGRGAPTDSTITRKWFLTVNIRLYYLLSVLVLLGAVFVFGCLLFNCVYSYRGFIAQSQPQCNNVFLAGCLLCLFSLLLLGLPAEGIVVHEHYFALLCQSRVVILMFGFTFAYGSMFAKVWWVHRMGATEDYNLAASKEEPIAAWKFQAVIAFLSIIDSIIIGFWIWFDPLQRKEHRFSLQEPSADIEEDIMLLPILELCQSKHQQVWIGLILGYKGLLLVFGLFLAYESRNMKLRYVNDSRFISLAIYNVAILSVITGPAVTLLIRFETNASFAFVSTTGVFMSVLLCTYISLGLVFIPKVTYIWRVPHSKDENDQFMLNRSKLNVTEQKRYQHLVVENAELQRQIELKETKIVECKKKLEERMRELSSTGRTITNRKSRGQVAIHAPLSISGEVQSSSPNTLTTTAFIETQPEHSNSSSGIENDDVQL